MSEFEDNLWREVVEEHGPELAHAQRPATGRGWRTRPRLLAGTTAGAVAVGTGVALLLSATASSPAFAVTRHRDGSVTVRLTRVSGIAGANRQLASMGVRAKIIQLVADTRSVAVGHQCAAPVVVSTMTLVPARIPSKRVLVLGADRRARLIYYASPAASGVAPLPHSAVAPIPIGAPKLMPRLIKRARALAASSTGATGTGRVLRPAPPVVGPNAPIVVRAAPVPSTKARILVPAARAPSTKARALVPAAPVLVPTGRIRNERLYCGPRIVSPPVATAPLPPGMK